MNHIVWKDYASGIDTLCDQHINTVIEPMKWVRAIDIPNATTDAKSTSYQVIDYADWDTFDFKTEIHRLNFAGLPITNPGALRQEDIRRLVQNLGMYWYEKGKGTFVDFIGYCLNAKTSIQKLWTNDYITFYPEGDSAIGTTVMDGGSWYPTSHVRLTFDSTAFLATSISNVTKLFYDLSPYNLVLESVVSVNYLPLTPTANPPAIHSPMPMISIAVIVENNQFITSSTGV